MRPVLALDIGNTKIKGCFFSKGEATQRYSWEGWDDWLEWMSSYPDPLDVVSGSVGLKEKDMNYSDLPHQVRFYKASTDWDVPVTICYESPQTLGIDRLAAVVGAWEKFRKACLVFDIGTCMTIDYVDENAQYVGGNIAPGWHMRLQAMHQMTSKLPFAEAKRSKEVFGTTTDKALQYGAYNGILMEIKGYVKAVKQRNEDVNVILTGGDANEFAKQLKMEIFALPDLVFEGLYKMLHAKLS